MNPLAFGQVSVSAPAATSTVTITNAGSDTQISGFTFSCPEFTAGAAGLPVTLANNGTLVVNVSYDPADRGADSCTVTITDDNGATDTFVLQGTGIGANLAITPVTTATFGDVRWNTATTATRDFTITNTGEESADVNLGFAPAGQGFTASSTMFTLPATTGSTVVTITFDPASPGAKAATLSATAATAVTPATIGLTGNGVASNQDFSAGSYNLGSTPQGGSATGAVTVTNTGATATASLNISGVAITGAQAGDFVLTDSGCSGQTCGASTVAIGGTRAYNITCTPSVAGTRNATLAVTSDDPTSGGASSTKNTAISCTGVAPTLAVSPTAVNFAGNTRVGAPAAPVTVTISNASGAQALTYAVVTSSATEFPLVCVTNPSCMGTVAQGASATITVGFVPAVVGARTGSITLTTNDPDPGDSTRVVMLTGTGAVSTLAATSPVAFGDVDINAPGGVTRTLGLQNTGGVPLNVGAMTITGEPGLSFSFAFGACTSGQTCPALTPIAPGATTTITLRCDPSTIAAKAATLNIPTDDPASPNRAVSLSCNGTTPDLQIAGTPLADFGNQRVGQLSSTTRTFTISNPATTTTSPLTWTVSESSPDFARTCSVAACTGTIMPGGAAVTVTVTFTPTGVGTRNGTIVVTSNDVSSPTVNIPVSGTGVDATVLLVTPTPTTPPTVGGALTFPDTAVTMTSAMLPITIQNTGTDTLTVSSVTKGGAHPGDFVVTGATPSTIGAGLTGTWNVQCAPTVQGTRTATITLNNDSSNDSSIDVTVTCLATRGHLFVVSATPIGYDGTGNQIDFGDTFLTQSKVTTVTLRNDGNRSVTVSARSFASTTQGFTFVAPTVTLPAVVMPGADLTMGIQFLPTLTTQGTTTVSLTTDWNPVSFTVTGNGQDSGVVYTRAAGGVCEANSITSFDFTQVAWNQTAAQQFCIKNIAEASATINSSVLANAGTNFTVTGLPPNNTVLTMGAFRVFTVTADPNDTMLGTFTSTVTSTTNLPAPNNVKVLNLSLTSTGPGIAVAPGATLDFGGIDVDDAAGRTMPVTITNTGNAVLDITGATGLAGSFSLTSGGGATAVMPGQSTTLMVNFRPTVERVSPTPESQTLVVNAVGYFDGNVRQAMGQQIIVTGYGIDQHVEVMGDGVFGDVYRNPRADDPRASKVLQVCNTGEAPLAVTMITESGTAFDVLGQASLTVNGVSAPGAAAMCQDVTVEFRPADEAYQSYTGTATLMNDDEARPMVTIDLTGRSIPRPVTIPSTLGDPDGPRIAVGVPVRLSELLGDRTSGLAAANVAVPAEPFDIEVRPGAGLAVVGDAMRVLDNGETEVYDLLITADSAGPRTFMVDVYLDGDVFPHGQTLVTVEAVDVNVRGGGGCSTGGGGASWLLLVLAAVPLAVRRRRRTAAGLTALAAALAVSMVPTAGAQSRDIDLATFSPVPTTEARMFAVETPILGTKGAWALDLAVNHALSPVAVENASNGETFDVVGARSTLELGFAYVVHPKVELGLRVPMLQQSGGGTGDNMILGVGAAEGGTALGDIAALARFGLTDSKLVKLGASIIVTAPTGKDGMFAGSRTPTGAGRLLLAITPGNRMMLAANAGFLGRGSASFASLTQGNALTFGAGVSVRTLEKLWVVAEGYGQMGLSGGDSAASSPLEATLGVRYRMASSVAVSLGGGTGIRAGVGSAKARGFLMLTLSPSARKDPPLRIIVPPPPRDTGDDDGDGVVNADDACPLEAEDMDGFQDTDGCPEADNDGDGVLDAEDKCPNQPEDMDGFQDADGCIDADNDEDGVPDVSDKCPSEPEDVDGFEDADGCPEPDNDNDGVPDVLDQCAMEPETINGNADEDGCPDKGESLLLVMPDRIEVLEPVTFQGTTTKLSKGASRALSQIGATLRADRKIKRLRITVHVQPRGGGDEALSQKRADEIKTWLLNWGVEPERIEAKGIGSKRPLVPKKAKGAAAINDRVEFIIFERQQ